MKKRRNGRKYGKKQVVKKDKKGNTEHRYRHTPGGRRVYTGPQSGYRHRHTSRGTAKLPTETQSATDVSRQDSSVGGLRRSSLSYVKKGCEEKNSVIGASSTYAVASEEIKVSCAGEIPSTCGKTHSFRAVPLNIHVNQHILQDLLPAAVEDVYGSKLAGPEFSGLRKGAFRSNLVDLYLVVYSTAERYTTTSASPWQSSLAT